MIFTAGEQDVSFTPQFLNFRFCFSLFLKNCCYFFVVVVLYNLNQLDQRNTFSFSKHVTNCDDFLFDLLLFSTLMRSSTLSIKLGRSRIDCTASTPCRHETSKQVRSSTTSKIWPHLDATWKRSSSLTTSKKTSVGSREMEFKSQLGKMILMTPN